MTTYLFKSTLCLAIFLLVYLLFLEKEKMHRFNRWYLLGSIVFACIVPFISFTIRSESLPILQDNYFDILDNRSNKIASGSITQLSNTPNTSTDYLIPALWGIYALPVFILLVRFARNIYLILSCISKNEIVYYHGAKLVLLKEKIASHSFFNYIFLSEEDYTHKSIEEEIITHELTHVKERHSWDVVFIELLQTICWFNPLFFFYKKAIRLNHEYLADDAVIKTYQNIPAYQSLLLDKVTYKSSSPLSSSFNYSITKKRLVMMTRTTNQASVLLKKISMIPLMAGILFIFSSKNVLAQDKLNPPVVNPSQTKNIPSTKEGVSIAVFAEYKALEKKYIFINAEGYENIYTEKISDIDRYRMESIFKQMNREQQSKTQVIFLPPIGPNKKNPPTEEQLNKWKNGDVYGVWIDPKKIKNEELNKYKASDFSYYSVSKLYPNARVNVKYFYQVDLITHAEFEKINTERKENRLYLMGFVSEKNRELNKERKITGQHITILPNATSIATVNIAGARKGDPILVSRKTDFSDWSFNSAWVFADNIVKVKFNNLTDKPVDIDKSQYKITIVK